MIMTFIISIAIQDHGYKITPLKYVYIYFCRNAFLLDWHKHTYILLTFYEHDAYILVYALYMRSNKAKIVYGSFNLSFQVDKKTDVTWVNLITFDYYACLVYLYVYIHATLPLTLGKLIIAGTSQGRRNCYSI